VISEDEASTAVEVESIDAGRDVVSGTRVALAAFALAETDATSVRELSGDEAPVADATTAETGFKLERVRAPSTKYIRIVSVITIIVITASLDELILLLFMSEHYIKIHVIFELYNSK
jgi:hypothetical protein